VGTFALMTTSELEQPSTDREQALLRIKKRRDPRWSNGFSSLQRGSTACGPVGLAPLRIY